MPTMDLAGRVFRDADVLKKEPKRFARAVGWEKGPIITLAADMAQIHLDMSLVCALSDDADCA